MPGRHPDAFVDLLGDMLLGGEPGEPVAAVAPGSSVALNPPTGYAPKLGAGGEINILDPKYGVKGDGNVLTNASITSGQAVVSSPSITTVMANPPKIGQLFSFIAAGAGAGIAAVPLTGTISSVNLAGGTFTVSANASNTVTGTGEVYFASDDTTGIVAWLADLITNNARGRIPNNYYGLNGTLTVGNQVAIVGDGCREIWGSFASVTNVWWPSVAPHLTGTVFWQFANADAILVSAVGAAIEFWDFGIMFANLFNGAGNGINVAPSPLYLGKLDNGLLGAYWQNIKVLGHDGNHYGFILQNFLQCTFNHLASYGGGGFKLRGEGQNNYGNSVFIKPAGGVITQGTADAWNITADAANRLNLINMYRPSGSVVAIGGGLQGAIAPTGSQRTYFRDNNSTYISTDGGDWESSVGSTYTGGTGGSADIATLGPIPWVSFRPGASNQAGLQVIGPSNWSANVVQFWAKGGSMAMGVTPNAHWINAGNGQPVPGSLGANVTSVTPTGSFSSDFFGILVVVMAGALARATKIATITFANSYGASQPIILLTNNTSGNLPVVVPYVLAQSTGVSFDLACDQALQAGTYTFGYIVIGVNNGTL